MGDELSGLFRRPASTAPAANITTAILLLTLVLFLVRSDAQQLYKTEPDFKPITIHVEKTSRHIAPGYIFVVPLEEIPNANKLQHSGLHIFDPNGDLVWFTNRTHGRPMRFHVCKYLAQPVLCLHLSEIVSASHGLGRILFLDETYSTVGEFGAVGELLRPDSHEINTPGDGETLLQDVYMPRKQDLTRFRGPEEGYVMDSCFQEVDIRSHKLLFQWCAMDHLPLWDTYAHLPSSANFTTKKNHRHGDGKRKQSGWDPFHINGIDMNSEGDYMISLRHADMIVKIAGNNNRRGLKPGHIMWKLRGGAHGEIGDFKHNFHFGGQHTCRFIETNSTKETISIFNNRYSGQTSNGLLVQLNNATMRAKSLQAYSAPHDWRAQSGGNMQVLPGTGNVFIGWGRVKPTSGFSEYSKEGKLLYHATLNQTKNLELYSAQAWKFPWVGKPLTKPKLLAYSRSCKSPLVAYVSWNGATEVKHWRFHVSSSPDGPWHSVRVFAKEGFETSAYVEKLGLDHMYVDALDSSGTVLASSEVVRTFMPKHPNRGKCGEWGCKDGYRYSNEQSTNAECNIAVTATSKEPGPLVIGAVAVVSAMLFLTVVELLSEVMDHIMFTLLGLGPEYWPLFST